MHTRKLARMTLATLSLAACLAFLGACVAIVHAHARGRTSADQISRHLSS
jgi:TRAP-type C4-dicarboxylate transport system permease small subunit